VAESYGAGHRTGLIVQRLVTRDRHHSHACFSGQHGRGSGLAGGVEGVSDGLSSFAKLASGYYTDRVERRKPIAVAGYLVTALGTAAFGIATAAWPR
jgi:hypothetical protein